MTPATIYDYGQRAAYRSARISKRSCAKSNTGIKPLITKFRIMARQGQGAWHGVRWDGKTATSFPLNETDEKKAMQALLLQHPFEEAASASDREIDANQKHVMSDHDKNLFIEQHNDGYAILRGGVKKPLAVEPTQDAAIEKARKLEPDAAIHVERVRNVEGGGRDKWRRI